MTLKLVQMSHWWIWTWHGWKLSGHGSRFVCLDVPKSNVHKSPWWFVCGPYCLPAYFLWVSPSPYPSSWCCLEYQKTSVYLHCWFPVAPEVIQAIGFSLISNCRFIAIVAFLDDWWRELHPRMGTLSAPGFITGRFHDPDTFSYSYKDNDSGRFGKWPGIGVGRRWRASNGSGWWTVC